MIRRLVLAMPLVGSAALLGWAGHDDARATSLPTLTVLQEVRRTLAPGATWTKRTLLVPGYTKEQRLLTIDWPLGDPHYRLRAIFPADTGAGAPSGPDADGWIPLGLLSRWAAARDLGGLVGMISDEPGSVSGSLGHPSGLLIRRGRIDHFFGHPTLTAPSVGYVDGGNLVFGYVRPAPLAFSWTGGQATVGSTRVAPANGEQVGVIAAGDYVVPPATRAYLVGGDPLAATYRGMQPVSLPSGGPANARRFVLRDTLHKTPQLAAAIAFAGAAGEHVTVPAGAALLVARAGGTADIGLTRAVAAGSILVNRTAPAWASAGDVMGGKPLLVTNGVPITTRYWALDDEQWAGPVTRIAIGRTQAGHGVLAIMGTRSGTGTGVGATEFAQALVGFGVTDALGLNVAHSPELFTPRLGPRRCAPYPGWCWRAQPAEVGVPTASALTYRR